GRKGPTLQDLRQGRAEATQPRAPPGEGRPDGSDGLRREDSLSLLLSIQELHGERSRREWGRHRGRVLGAGGRFLAARQRRAGDPGGLHEVCRRPEGGWGRLRGGRVQRLRHDDALLRVAEGPSPLPGGEDGEYREGTLHPDERDAARSYGRAARRR